MPHVLKFRIEWPYITRVALKKDIVYQPGVTPNIYDNKVYKELYDIKLNDISREFESAEPSTVYKIGEQDVVDTSLRKSMSVRKSYRVDLPKCMKHLFVECEVGIGNMHVYKKGDFMKKHYDTRLPDEWVTYTSDMHRKYPHIMTLLIIQNFDYTGGDLVVEDSKLVSPEEKSFTGMSYGKMTPAPYIGVLFSLNAAHEVLPVLDGTRVVFAFPVYGTYNPTSSITQRIVARDVTTVKNHVLRELKEELMYAEGFKEEKADSSTRRAIVQGYVAALNDSDILKMFVRYRNKCGDVVPAESIDYAIGYGHGHDCSDDDADSNRSYVITVSYNIGDEPHEYTLTEKPYKVPEGATNIIIKRNYGESDLLRDIIDEVEALQEANKLKVENPAMSDKYEDEIDPCKEELQEILTKPFIVLLGTTYYEDVTINDLDEDDMNTYIMLRNMRKRITLVHKASIQADRKLPYLVRKGDKLCIPKTFESSCVASLYLEFNDEGSYIPTYTLGCSMLIVE